MKAKLTVQLECFVLCIHYALLVYSLVLVLIHGYAVQETIKY